MATFWYLGQCNYYFFIHVLVLYLISTKSTAGAAARLGTASVAGAEAEPEADDPLEAEPEADDPFGAVVGDAGIAVSAVR